MEMNNRGNEEAFFQVLCQISDLRCHIFSYINGVKYDNIISGDWIARNGYFSLMLEKHRNNEPLIFTTNAMDYAAERGNLEMLKWIHYNIGSGCTEQALYAACRLNRLDIIEFINDNYLLRYCTGCAAMATKKLSIIQYLHNIRVSTNNGCCCHDSVCCSGIFYSALADENIALLNWLYDVGVTSICDCFDENHYYVDCVNNYKIEAYLEDMCRNNRRLSLNWLLNRINYIYHDSGWLVKRLTHYSFLSGNQDFTTRFLESGLLFYEQRDLDHAIVRGHHHIIQHLHCHFSDPGLLISVIEPSIKSGNLEMLRFIVAEIGANQLVKLGAGKLFGFAMVGGNRQLLEYIINLLNKLNMNIPPINSVSLFKVFYQVDMLDLLYHTPGIVLHFDDSDMEAAIFHGEIQLVKWLVDNTHLTIPDYAMDIAAASGHLELCKWLFENMPFNLSHEGIMEAEYECIKWYLENIEEMSEEVILDTDSDDISKWDLDFIGLLHRKNIPILPEYISGLAEWGKLDILQWLHHNTNYQFHQATRAAVIGGELAVLKWLQQINQLEFDEDLINLAIAGRNLAIIIWVHKNTPGDYYFRDHDINRFVAHDDVCLIQLLFNRGILSDQHIEKVIKAAIGRGAVEVLQWMITQYGMDCTKNWGTIVCYDLRTLEILDSTNLSVYADGCNLNPRQLRSLNRRLGKLQIIRYYSENILYHLFENQGILKFLERNTYLIIAMLILLPLYSILDVVLPASAGLLFIRRINYLLYLICLVAKFIETEIVAR